MSRSVLFVLAGLAALATVGLMVAFAIAITPGYFAGWVTDYPGGRWIPLGVVIPVTAVLAGLLAISQGRGSAPKETTTLPPQIKVTMEKEKPAPSFVPEPPTPYFAHPYPLQDNFTGRASERRLLTEWLTEDDRPVLALTAIGGMGKSALTWAWLQRDVLGLPLPGQAPDLPDAADSARVPEDATPEGVLWWSFYETEAAFSTFLDRALTYASGGAVDPATVPSDYDKVQALVNELRQRRILVVLDGFERELRAYATLSAAYQMEALAEEAGEDGLSCVNPHASNFLRFLASGALGSRVLLTSRLFPRELEGLAGCRHEDLDSLDPEDAVAFFLAHGIKGNRPEIEAACEPYGYHPLALRLLAGMLTAPGSSGDIHQADAYTPIPHLVPREHHILELAYDALDSQLRDMLSRIAAFRSPVDYETLAALFGQRQRSLSGLAALKNLLRFPWRASITADLNTHLVELVERGLLLREGQRYDLHPIVRRYSYDRLRDKKGVHSQLRDYFSAIPQPEEEEISSVDDLAEVIELYHHTVRAGRYDEANDLFYDRLHVSLFYRLGAYQAIIELLRALFPDGEDVPPRLEDESDQAWALSALAMAYSLSGQPRRAVPLKERHNALRETTSDKRNLAFGHQNLALDQLKLGEMVAAEASFRRSIGLCRETAQESGEAIGHRELGRLLAHRGAFQEATREFDSAYTTLSQLSERQHQGLVCAYRTRTALLAGKEQAALDAARESRKLADVRGYERDVVGAEWLLGWAHVALASASPAEKGKNLGEAEAHLTEALTRCRRITMVDHEADILLAWARWHRLSGNADQARQHADEALAIAGRCELRLQQADIHNFLAGLSLDEGDRAAAVEHARNGYERAWCDGPPHAYQPALDEAKRLLGELGEKPPDVPTQAG